MLCLLSGEEAQEPVVSPKSGCIFEKRLIELYIATTGKDPVSEDALALEELIVIKNKDPVIVPPKPAAFNSIPTMLAAFQNEWDSLVLESFTLRKELHNARQELSAALYQYDAAVRVAGRAMKERDEAREALTQLLRSFAVPEAEKAPELASVENDMETAENDDVHKEVAEYQAPEAPSAAPEATETENAALEAPQPPQAPAGEVPISESSESQHNPTSSSSETHRNHKNQAGQSLQRQPPEFLRRDIQNAQNYLFPIHKNLKLTVPGTVSGKIDVAYKPSSHTLNFPRPRIAVSSRGEIAVYDTNNILLVPSERRIHRRHIVNNIAFTASGGQLLIAGDGHKVAFYSVDHGDEHIMNHKQSQIYNIISHPHAPFSLVVAKDRYALVDDQQELFDSGFITTGIHEEALHVDGRLLAIGTKDGKILIVDILNNEIVATVNTKYERISKLQFAYNGYWLFAASHPDLPHGQLKNGAVQLFDLRKNSLVQEFLYDNRTEFAIDGSSLVLVTAVRPKRTVHFHLYNKKEKKWNLDAEIVNVNETLIQIEPIFNANVSPQNYKPEFMGLSKTHLHHFTVSSL